MVWGFTVGQIYKRAIDIHQRLGGSTQAGIITFSQHPLIIAVTGSRDDNHPYADKWTSDGVFEYTGQGNVGDMKMQRGNSAIRDHVENGKDLLLFEYAGKGGMAKFLGQFACEAFHLTAGLDRNNDERESIIFELRPIDTSFIDDPVEDVLSVGAIQHSLKQMRVRALDAAKTKPREANRSVTLYERSIIVRDYVLARANGRCEHCFEAAPFIKENGRPFLEAHHIRRLTDGGPDDPRFMIGVCPNCHRAAHYSVDKLAINKKMQAEVAKQEKELSK
jgi:5-methylcytosine-specific restriction protein A